MVLASITFFSGLAISAVAIYYSVIGLAAIFAAAVVPIMIMGSILEVSKLVAAWWLKANWYRAPFLLKSYMLIAVIVLMLITSMGIFGFLSKAHTEQAVPVGDNLARIEIIDERIAIEQEIIAQARQDIGILDQQIERFTELGAVTRGVNTRNQQREEREALTQQILQAQEKISELRLERAPFAASLRAIEAEVGPIKYIAKLIYGDNTDSNMMEQAVVWIIIVIVFVFDPLAVLLLLASQMSFKWAREERELKAQAAIVPPAYEPDDGPLSEEQIEQIQESVTESVEETTPLAEVLNESVVEKVVEEPAKVEYLEKLSELLHTPVQEFTTPVVETVKESAKDVDDKALESETTHVTDDSDPDDDDDEILNNARDAVKRAMTKWKDENPKNCLKTQRSLLKRGLISELPWEKYIEPEELDEDQQAAVEAARWAEEQLEESKKKDIDLDGKDRRETSQEVSGGLAGYVQNAEQSDSTLWKRVQAAKGVKND
jgi:flagellar basal body-associated protein FliL